MADSEGIVEYRQKMERYFSDKVESMLERVVGAGNAVVRVSTEIDASRVSMMQKILAVMVPFCVNKKLQSK